MSRWIVRRRDVECGYDGRPVEAGTPVLEITVGPVTRYRCVEHAGRPVNQAQVDACRAELEAERTRQFHRVLRKGGDIRGVQTASGPRPFSEVASHPAVRRSTELD